MDTWPGNSNDPLSLHKYLYSGADPVNHIDPSGHFFSLGEIAATLDIKTTLSTSQIDAGTSLLDVALDPNNAEQGFTQGSALFVGLGILGPSGAKILKTLSRKASEKCKNKSDTCIRALLGRINIPEGVAEQLDSPSAWDLLKKSQSGAPLYRLGKLGKSNTVGAQFWSLKDPTTMSPKEFAKAFGIPKENASFDFFIKGRLLPGKPAITRVAPGAGGNPGGALELVTAPGSVLIESFHMF
jgi:hypothetical protein